MLDNIIVKVPNKLELRAYTWQILKDNSNFSHWVSNYLNFLNSGFGDDENHMNLDVISDDEIKAVLEKGCFLPEYIFFLKIADSSFNERCIGFDYKKMPEFFTNVRDAFLLNNDVEFIVMEHFNHQVLTLYDKNWENQLGDCTDIEHGTDGNLLVRSIGSCFWDNYKYIDNELTSIDGYEPADIPKNSKRISRLKVEIYHPEKSENPKLIFRKEEPCNANINKKLKEESADIDEFLDLPF